MSDLEKKVRQSIRLLQAIPTDKGDIELCYSGGKDSDVILELAKMAGIPFRAIYKNTTIDPPYTIQHCKENGVEIVNPQKTFFQLVQEQGFPSRWQRFCCSKLKEYKICDIAIHGIRRSESRARAERYKEPQVCRFYGSKKNHVSVFLPILEWTDQDVAEFIKERNINCHPLYYRGGQFDVTQRLGCMGCPLQSRKKRIEFFKQNPKWLRCWIRAASNYYKCRAGGKNIYRDAFDAMAAHLFFDNSSKFIADTYSLFGTTDWKAELERIFNINLDGI